jgi:type IV secretory pathway VirB6-like protein
MLNSQSSILKYQSVLKAILCFLFFVIIFSLFNESLFAQCPMCKASAEASIKGGSTAAKGLNKGIIYLLMMPYLLFSVIFLLWYKNYRKSKVVVG